MLHRKAQGHQPFDYRRQPVSEFHLQWKLVYLKILDVAQWEKSMVFAEYRTPAPDESP